MSNENPVSDDGPTSVVVPTAQSTVETFSSRGKARAYVRDNGGKFHDNGVGSDNRWTVDTSVESLPASVTKMVGGVNRNTNPGNRTSTVTATAKPAGDDKKTVAIALYSELEAAGTLKRSTFLTQMASKTGLSAKGASSYFYRIKGGSWS
jgi:hypothetical protein